MLLICVATASEADLLRANLPADHGVRIVEMGVGPVNAAHAVTVAAIQSRPSGIVVCGVGGAYPSSGLQLGDVVCAEMESYGDLGADSPSGFLDMQALGFPVVRGATTYHNELPLQLFPARRRARFVTVSTCTGTAASARAIEARTRGAVENMEGAAVAHVALLHDIPCGEIRGISNIVTDRDRGSWRLREASEAAQAALLAWVTHR